MSTGRGQTCRADKGGFCLWPECPASDSTDDPCPLPLPVPAGRSSTAVADLLREYGNAWRGDWSDCDGRTIKSELGYVAGLIVQASEGEPVDVAEARRELGLCAEGGGHWTDHCREGYCPTSADARPEVRSDRAPKNVRRASESTVALEDLPDHTSENARGDR